ncbi:baseplate J/gp47 family protein [Massilia rhizosphaerae]|uniref:baseplate J/gp47 family protein n=1 Tax=Massilia rhizosphaerae TaxID=2784389 RepID=UPI0018DCF364|nr:baseplate J/gp47 family protein [Massilia rhizosphaerae]
MCAASLKAARTAGLSRAARFRPALDPASAPVEERTLAQWLARAPAYAKLLNYFDASGTPVADWSSFWSSDAVYLLAQMALRTPSHRAGGDSAQVTALHATARRFNGWLHQIRLQLQYPTTDVNPILPVLVSLIVHRLAPAVAGLRGQSAWDAQWRALEAALPAPQEPWAPEWQPADLTAGNGPAAAIPLTLIGIAAQFDGACAKLSQQAELALAQSLQRSNHPAHSALFVSFVQLFVRMQDDVNCFTARHLDYYYNDVLRLKPSSGTPDAGTLVFALAANCPSYLLPEGSTVSAGQDSSGQAILYATQQAVSLNQAAIGALRTVLRQRGADGRVSAVYAAPVADSQDGLGAPLLAPEHGWPTFGAVPSGGPESALAATPGLLLASPALALRQGERQVVLHMQFGGDTAALQDAFAAAAPVPPPATSAPHRVALPADAFLLYVSGAAGWTRVPRFRLVRLAPGTDWLLRFVLPASFPAVAPNGKLEPGVTNGWPMLKLVLNPNAVHYAYSFVDQLRLSALQVRAKVWGLAPAQMNNSTGPIAVGKPFTPFTSAPLPGMSWSLSHPELTLPTLSWVRVDMEWLNLPLVSTAPPLPGAPNGFAQYYSGYKPFNFSNAMFGADLAFYRGGRWEQLAPASGATEFALFADQDGSVLAVSSWFFRGAAATSAGGPSSIAPADGTLRAGLLAPPYGFGQAQFPALFAAAAVQNVIAIEKAMRKDSLWKQFTDGLRKLFGKGASALKKAAGGIGDALRWVVDKIKSVFHKDAAAPDTTPASAAATTPAPAVAPIPGVIVLNPPFVPTLKTVQLSYKSVTAVPLDGDQFYHVHAFGLAPPAQPSLFPLEPGDGNLYVGLADAGAGQPVSLHVELRAQPASAVRLLDGQVVGAGPVSWRYLAGDRWQAFPPGTVASATSDLGVSGIVTLNLPADFGGPSTIMGPAGTKPLGWIAASVGTDPDGTPATIAILSQAATVRRLAPPSSRAGASLPAGSITTMMPHIAAIKQVIQPYATGGGEAAEDPRAFHVRVSERLRHKQRASQARDYEQLVLDRFPMVAQVKCVGPNNSRDYPFSAPLKGGQLVLVLAPAPGQDGQLGVPFPRPLLLGAAQAVSALASGAVADVTVRNVLYETLQVDAAVSFQPGMDVNQCSTKLNQLLRGYLSPAGDQLELGSGAIAVGLVAALIRQQPYVARLESLCVWQRAQDGSRPPLQLGIADTAAPGTPWSALVSAPRHAIAALPAPQAAPAEEAA